MEFTFICRVSRFHTLQSVSYRDTCVRYNVANDFSQIRRYYIRHSILHNLRVSHHKYSFVFCPKDHEMWGTEDDTNPDPSAIIGPYIDTFKIFVTDMSHILRHHTTTNTPFIGHRLVNRLGNRTRKQENRRQKPKHYVYIIWLDYLLNTINHRQGTHRRKQPHKKPLYTVNIDLDSASRFWRLNKQAYGEDMFRYIPVKK